MSPQPFKFTTPADWFTRIVNLTVIGIGGTGSEVLANLASIDYAIRELGHPGLHVTAWDGDIVEPPNIGRQKFFPADLGQNKAIISVQRINVLYGLNWSAEPRRFLPDQGLDSQCDLLISCVDKAKVRAEIGESALNGQAGMLWIDTGNGSHTGQVILGHLGESDRKATKRLPNVYEFYPELASMTDNDTPSCSMEEALSNQDLPINRSIANVVMQMVWLLLRHGGLNHQGAFIDIRKGATVPINI